MASKGAVTTMMGGSCRVQRRSSGPGSRVRPQQLPCKGGARRGRAPVTVVAKQMESQAPVKKGSAAKGACKDLKDVVAAQQFSKEMLAELFEVAQEMREVKPGTPESQVLQGMVMSALFYEPSTRTRLSFEAAMLKLGGAVTGTENAGQYSSAAKGETLEGETP